MEKAMVKVVRFDAADVIATSSVNPYANLTPGGYYSVLRTEATTARLTYNVLNDSDQFVFFAVGYDGTDINGSGVTSGYMSEYNTYAWFDNGQWQTDNFTVQYYIDNRIDNKVYSDSNIANWRTE